MAGVSMNPLLHPVSRYSWAVTPDARDATALARTDFYGFV